MSALGMTDDDLMPAPDTRAPNMTEMPVPGNDITDADLMTDEELGDQQVGMPEMAMPAEHDENLADALATTATGMTYLKKLGQDIIEMVAADEQSREPWKQRFKRGLQIVGLEDFVWDNDAAKAPFEGASTALHPGIAQAVVQSQARYMEELFPAAGPVKTLVMGKDDDAKQDAADRVADHMNYQLTKEDLAYFMETSKLAFYLPIFGTSYRKGYHDWITDKNVLRFCTAEEIILPYTARSLYTSPRITHKFQITENDFRKCVRAGAYRDIDLQDPGEKEVGAIQEEKDRTDSKVAVEPTQDQGTNYDFFETDIYLDIPGYEDIDEVGKETGVALPYTVTVESVSGDVLRIERCWKESNPLKDRLIRYAEYWYMPGIGSYGYGLIHLIGSLAEAATDSLRALLDSATWANLQGGFKAKDAASKGGELHMQPGVWIDVDMTSAELSSAFHTPPFKEPSEALFKLLSFLADEIKTFSGTTELMVGEGAKGPVGTTIAMIEQGSKVYAGVHKRGHFAAGIEFGMLFDLNSRYIPAEGYPYAVPGDDKEVFRSDYDTSMVCVVPVSDPNIFSQTQRIAQAQTGMEIAEKYPMLHRPYQVVKRMYEALKTPNWEEMVVDPDDVPDMDPVTENIAMATQRPVKAKEGQNHAAHLAVHMAFAQHPQYGGLPQAQAVLGPAMMAHIAEHVGLLYADNQRQLGVPVPPINLANEPGSAISQTPLPPDANNMIAAKAAEMVGAFAQQSGLTTTPPAAGGGTDADGLKPEDKQLLNDSLILEHLGAAAANFAKAGISLAVGALEVPGLDMTIHSAGPAQMQGALPAADGTAPPAASSAPPAMPRPARAPAPRQPALPGPIKMPMAPADVGGAAAPEQKPTHAAPMAPAIVPKGQ